MSKRKSFSGWLLAQVGRNDPIGELAREIQADAAAPVWAFRAITWRVYLRGKGADQGTIEAIDAAFLEFSDRAA